MKKVIFAGLLVSFAVTSFAGIKKCVADNGEISYTDGVCMTAATSTNVKFYATNVMVAFKAPVKPVEKTTNVEKEPRK